MNTPKFLCFEELVRDHERLCREVEELKQSFEGARPRQDRRNGWSLHGSGATSWRESSLFELPEADGERAGRDT